MAEDVERGGGATAGQGPEAPELMAIAESLGPEPAIGSHPGSDTDDSGGERGVDVSEDDAADEASEDVTSEASAPGGDNVGGSAEEAEAPGSEAANDAEPVPSGSSAVPAPRDSVPWTPFIVYVAVWVVFAGVVIWRFSDVPQGQAVYDSPFYPLSVLAGVALTVAGPLLSLATWAAAWGAPGASRWGQFVSALVKGSVATACGVLLWWIALVIVDQVRLGRVF